MCIRDRSGAGNRPIDFEWALPQRFIESRPVNKSKAEYRKRRPDDTEIVFCALPPQPVLSRMAATLALEFVDVQTIVTIC
eukprot:5804498-Amphidinium_carterae.1